MRAATTQPILPALLPHQVNLKPGIHRRLSPRLLGIGTGVLTLRVSGVELCCAACCCSYRLEDSTRSSICACLVRSCGVRTGPALTVCQMRSCHSRQVRAFGRDKVAIPALERSSVPETSSSHEERFRSVPIKANGSHLMRIRPCNCFRAAVIPDLCLYHSS